jgi:hypothetical protein
MNILQKFFSKGSDLVTRDIGGETIIVPVRDGVGDLNSIYTLDELASRIWQLIDGRTHVKEMVETITEEYEVSEEEATKDISEYLDILEKANLICQTPE